MIPWEVPTDMVARLTDIVSEVVQGLPAGRRAAIALSGGTTPAAAFRSWCDAETRYTGVDWSRTELFWGDERPVPPESADSNYGNACRLWLDHSSMPAAQIHPWKTDLSADEAAGLYAEEIRRHVHLDPDGLPRFDLVLLGVGPEGHTASLFPDSPAFDAPGWTASPYVPEKDTLRFTLTPRVLCAAGRVVFLAEGAEKRDIVKTVLSGPNRTRALPAQWVAEASNSLWLLDRGAAAGLIGTV